MSGYGQRLPYVSLGAINAFGLWPYATLAVGVRHTQHPGDTFWR